MLSKEHVWYAQPVTVRGKAGMNFASLVFRGVACELRSTTKRTKSSQASSVAPAKLSERGAAKAERLSA